MQDRTRKAARSGAAAIALCLGALGLSASGAATQGGAEAPVEATRATLAQLAETQRLISQERRQWKVSRELLTSQIDVVQREIDSLREKIDEAKANVAEADEKREELVTRDGELKAAGDALRARAGELEARTRSLLARFPEPLLDVVRPLSQRLPSDAEHATGSLAERFLNVVGILKYANKFQRDLSAGSEVRSFADGSSSEVVAMYLGLGQAYYANAKGTAAGVGRPGSDGWVWTPTNEAAAAIARAIAIHDDQGAADYVPLPVRIE